MRSDFCRDTDSAPVRSLSACAAILGLVLLSGCDKAPGGQVVAVVDGHEITQQDVRAQALSEKITTKPALDAAAPRIVQQLVNRTVLSDYARENHLDRGPEYIARRRQLEETLLSYLALRKLVGKLDTPAPADVKAYVAANPLMFARRERLNLDQIQFPTAAAQQKMAELAKLDSLDAIAAKLRTDGVKFSRAPAYFDTGQVDRSLAEQIARLSDGEVFNLSAGGTTYFSEIKSRVPLATKPSDWEAQAQGNMQRKMLMDSVSSKIDNLKNAAKIEYDPAYRPKGK